MSDELPGGAPAFEEPDFSRYETGEEGDLAEDDELDELDEADDELDEADDELEEADDERADEASSSGGGEGGAALAVLEHLAKSIVDEKEAVSVRAERQRGQLRLYLTVAPSDMGRIIGRRGRTAQALRTLVRAAAASENNNDVFVEIVD